MTTANNNQENTMTTANNNQENTMTIDQVAREYDVFVALLQEKYPQLNMRNETSADVAESLALFNAGGPYDNHVHLGSGYLYIPAPVEQEHLVTEIYLSRPNAEYKNSYLQMVDMYTDDSGDRVIDVHIIKPSLRQRVQQMTETDLEEMAERE